MINKPHPHPRIARLRAKLSWRALAKKAGIGLATISRAEKSGLWPSDRGTRTLYLYACGLPTGLPELDAAVQKDGPHE